MEVHIKVTLDAHNEIQYSKTIKLEHEKSLNHFRRECSKAFQVDVVTLYLHNGELITDTLDIEFAKRVIASTHFSLRNILLTQSDNPCPIEGETTSASTACFDCKNPVIYVEVLSHPDSGKTTLIQTFIHEYCQKENHSIIEAVYRKKIDINFSTFEFLVADSLEGADIDIVDRLKDKRAVIIACSKERFISAMENNSMEGLQIWLLESVKKARLVCPLAYVCLAITKYDIICETESIIQDLLNLLAREVPVFRVSVMDCVFYEDIYSPLQLFNMVGENISRELIMKRKTSKLRMSRRSKKESARKNVSGTDWFARLKKMFRCFPLMGFR